MYKADMGDILYYIIFAIVILVGLFDKISKTKRQQQESKTPIPPQPHDDFEDVEEQTPPQSLEDVMRRMFQTMEDEPETVSYDKMKSKVVVPEELPLHLTNKYQPVCDTFGTSEKTPFPQEEIEEAGIFQGIDFEFDARQAVIASEILNRKY